MSDDGEDSDSNGNDGSGDDDPASGEPGDEHQSDGGIPRLDRYFDALADQRRRYVLYYLQRCGAASEKELARHVVARETGRPADDLDDEEYQRARSSLHHSHLPRLADYGLVEFDPRSEAVRFEEPPQAFAALLWLSRLVEGEQRT